MQDFIKIHGGDNVAVALKPLSAGTKVLVESNEVELITDIPQGHKFALKEIFLPIPIISRIPPFRLRKRDFSRDTSAPTAK